MAVRGFKGLQSAEGVSSGSRTISGSSNTAPLVSSFFFKFKPPSFSPVGIRIETRRTRVVEERKENSEPEEEEEKETELASELKKAMQERKEKEKEKEKEKDLLSGVTQEIAEIEWPAFAKVLGTTGVVLTVIFGSSVVLLTVNAVLAELSDRLFAGKGVQDFFT